MIADDLSRIAMSSNLHEALGRAVEYARAQSHLDVTLEHMLLALCEDDDAGLVLAASNIEIARLRTDVSGYLGRLEERAAPGRGADPIVSSDLRRILEAAAAAAKGGRRNEINGAIVLAAIVGDGKSPAAHMLRAQGLTFEGAIRALQRGTSATSRSPSGPASADDILANARERVQTRIAPGLGGLSGERIGAAPRERTPEPPASEAAEAEPVAEDAAPSPDQQLAVPTSYPDEQLAPAEEENSAAGALPQEWQVPAEEPSEPFAIGARVSPNPYEEQVRPPSPSARPAPPPIPAPAGPPAWAPPPVPAGGASPPPRRLPQMLPRPASGPGPRPGPPPLAPWPQMDEPHRPEGVGASVSGPSPEAVARKLGLPPRTMPGPPPATRSRPGVRAEIGQLVENIPRNMRVAVPTLVEVRIARANVKALAEGLQGGGAAYRHEVTVTKAMSVRLRAPDGGFFIETASPETQWIEKTLLLSADDFASWRWNVTPRDKGKKRLQMIISARTVSADGLAAETALPDQVITVRVRTNYAKSASRWAGWAAAAVVGGLMARFGEGAFDAGLQVVAKLMAG